MNAKEKAIELFKKYYCLDNSSKSRIKVIELTTAKKCAIIAVDEILNQLSEIEFYDVDFNNELIIYWNEVKKEIELL